jgi:CO/xanthine dehydrogenase FAD-binding subunit
MILAYHRPETLNEALQLLARSEPITVALGGGTALNRASDIEFEVVDLQALGIDRLEKRSKIWQLGAMLTLQDMLASDGLDRALAQAIRHQATYNTRQIATIAGTLVAADGRSPFVTAMLALDAQLTIFKKDADLQKVALGEFLPLRSDHISGALITQVNLPVGVSLAYHYVARTPADLPIVCAAVCQWPSGRTRVALGGYGSTPILAMDGPHATGAEIAARDAYSEAGDRWASADYRSEIAATLTTRGLKVS